VFLPASDLKWVDLDPKGGHTTSCDKAADCVFFVEANGKFDLKPVEAATAPAKK
jgi:hypothetical protein